MADNNNNKGSHSTIKKGNAVDEDFNSLEISSASASNEQKDDLDHSSKKDIESSEEKYSVGLCSLTIFFSFSILDIVYCIVYLWEEIPRLFCWKSIGLFWLPLSFGFMDILTIIRIIVQIESGVRFSLGIYGARNTMSAEEFNRHGSRFVRAGVFVMIELSLSLCFSIFRLPSKYFRMDETLKDLTLNYLLLNYLGLTFYVYALVYLRAHVGLKLLDLKYKREAALAQPNGIKESESISSSLEDPTLSRLCNDKEQRESISVSNSDRSSSNSGTTSLLQPARHDKDRDHVR